MESLYKLRKQLNAIEYFVNSMVSIEEICDLPGSMELKNTFAKALLPGLPSLETYRLASGAVSNRLFKEAESNYKTFWDSRLSNILQRGDGFRAISKAELDGGLMLKAIDKVGKPYVKAKDEDIVKYKHSNLASHVDYTDNGKKLNISVLIDTAKYLSSFSVVSLFKIHEDALNRIELIISDPNDKHTVEDIVNEFSNSIISILKLSKTNKAPGFMKDRYTEIYKSTNLSGNYSLYLSTRDGDTGLFAIHSDANPIVPEYVPFLTTAEMVALQKSYLTIEEFIVSLSKDGSRMFDTTAKLLSKTGDALKKLDDHQSERRAMLRKTLAALSDMQGTMIYIDTKLATYLNSVLSGYMQALLYSKRIAKDITGLR